MYHRQPRSPSQEDFRLIERATYLVRIAIERKRVEEALVKKERLLSESQRIAHIGSWSWDLTGPINWTDETYRIYGVSPETFTPTVESLVNLVHPEDQLAMQRWIVACGAGQSPDDLEFRRILPDGSVRLLSGRGEMQFENRPAYMTGTVQDITERKRAEQRLAESERRLRTIIESEPECVKLLGPNCTLLEMNSAGLRMIEATSLDQVVGKSVLDLILPEYRDSFAGLSERVLRGESGILEFEIEGFRGTRRLLETHAAPLFNEQGQVESVLGITRDITERKQAEEKVERSRELLRALTARLQAIREEERSRIAREIHDELGQALTALKMDLSWCAKRMPADQNPLVEKTKSMMGLVDETVRTVRRIATDLRPGILDDLGLVAAIEWQAEEFQNRSRITCSLTTEVEDLALDEARTTALFRILQESLTNVARHSEATHVDVRLKKSDAFLTLEIRDNGKGISPSERSGTRSLGLLGMRERARLLGGEFTIHGAEGAGTTVVVRIPNGS
jgi:PAS domain S-box-containing protein